MATDSQQANAIEQTYEHRKDARHQRELRLWELAKTNADVRMVLWERDSAHVRINLLSMALGGYDTEVRWPGHNQDIFYRLRTLLHPDSMEAEYAKELAAEGQAGAGAEPGAAVE